MNPNQVGGFENREWIYQISTNNHTASWSGMIREFCRNLTILILGYNTDIWTKPEKTIKTVDQGY
jgi:hypothetical protein